MIVTKESLKIDWPLVMAGLVNISGIISKTLDYFNDKIILEVEDNWTEETNLDTLISQNTIEDTSSEIIVSQISVFTPKNIREFKNKIKKSSFKNKINHYSINTQKEGENGNLILNVSENWSAQDTADLDTLLDSLLGYDVIAEKMEDYIVRAKEGFIFYNKERCKLVDKMENGEFTADELYYEIDIPLEKAKVHLHLGDLKSAYKDISDMPTGPIFTPALQVELLTNLGASIAKVYS